MRYTHFKTLVLALALAMGAAAQPGTSATFRGVSVTDFLGIPRVSVLPLFGKPGGIIYLTATADSGLYMRHQSGTYWMKVGPTASGGGSYVAGNGIKLDGSTIRWADTLAPTFVVAKDQFQLNAYDTLLSDRIGILSVARGDVGLTASNGTQGSSGLVLFSGGNKLATLYNDYLDVNGNYRVSGVEIKDEALDSFVAISGKKLKLFTNVPGEAYNVPSGMSTNLKYLAIDSTNGEVFTAPIPTNVGTTYTAGVGIKGLGPNSLQTGVVRWADSLNASHTFNMFGGSTLAFGHYQSRFDGNTGSIFTLGQFNGTLQTAPNISFIGAMVRTQNNELLLRTQSSLGESTILLKGDTVRIGRNSDGLTPYIPKTASIAKYKVVLMDSTSGALVTTSPANIGGGGGMVYPPAGIPLSTGTAWGSSISNNSANWNTAFGWGNHATAGYATAAGLTAGLATKENSLGSGTTSQWLRGDKTWTTVPNFANADLTATGPRQHLFNGHGLDLHDLGTFSVRTIASPSYESAINVDDFVSIASSTTTTQASVTVESAGNTAIVASDSIRLHSNFAAAPYNRSANTTSNYGVMLFDKTSGAVVHDDIKRYRTPRLTIAERNALASPEPGDEIFNTDDGYREYYDAFWGWMPISDDIRWKRKYGFNEYTDLTSPFPAAATGTGWIGATNSGTGATVSYGASASLLRQGVAIGSTGTTATGRAGFAQNNNISFLGNGRSIFYAGVLPATLSTSTERYQITVGHSDNATGVAATDGVYFLYDEGGVHAGSTASANWQCVTSSNGTRTFTTTSVPVSTSVFADMEIRVNDNSSSAEFYLNGTLVATHTTNIPSGTARATNLNAQIYKTIGTTARTMQIDYIGYKQKFTNPRF
jgi:hypothetical protein